MSMFADLINAIGTENFQGLLAVVIAGLMGKNYWDTQNFKRVLKKDEFNIHVDLLKKEIIEQLEEEKIRLVELKNSSAKEIEETKNELNKLRETTTSQIKVLAESTVSQTKEEMSEIKDKITNKIENIESRIKNAQEKSEESFAKFMRLISELDKPKISRAEIRKMKDIN